MLWCISFFFLQHKGTKGKQREIKGEMSSGIVSSNSLWADVMAPRLSPVLRLLWWPAGSVYPPSSSSPSPPTGYLLSGSGMPLHPVPHPAASSARRRAKLVAASLYAFNFHCQGASYNVPPSNSSAGQLHLWEKKKSARKRMASRREKVSSHACGVHIFVRLLCRKLWVYNFAEDVRLHKDFFFCTSAARELLHKELREY